MLNLSSGMISIFRVWCAPSADLVKINTDASLSDKGQVGLGALARDKNGKVLFSTMRRTREWWPPDIAESKAIHMVVCWARQQRLKKVIIELDSHFLFSRLSLAALYYSDLDAIIGKITYLCIDFCVISFSHVRKGGISQLTIL